MGKKAKADCVTYKLRDDERVKVVGIRLAAMATPRHTDDPLLQYDSLFNKLLKLLDKTLVYPDHDYNGMMVLTIGKGFSLYTPHDPVLVMIVFMQSSG